MLRFLTVLLLCVRIGVCAEGLQRLLQTHGDQIAKPSRKKVGVVLEALLASGLPQVPVFLQNWQGKAVDRLADGRFVYEAADGFTDIDTGAALPTGDARQIKPNGGVRRAIGDALVQFQLSDPDPARRAEALDALARGADAGQLAPLLGSIDGETDPGLKARKKQLAGYLTARFGETPAARVAAIDGLASDLSVDGRAVLSQLLRKTLVASKGAPEGNIAQTLIPGETIPTAQAYDMLVAQGLPPVISRDQIMTALANHVEGGRAGSIPLAAMHNWDAWLTAYDALAETGAVPPRVTPAAQKTALDNWSFAEVYDEPDPTVTAAAEAAQKAVQSRVGFSQTADLTLDAISLASIYFLAAIGLAITFGVMGVINMAHGEFIMMGAYTGYVVQLFIPDYTVSLIVALPLAFAVTFAAVIAGVAIGLYAKVTSEMGADYIVQSFVTAVVGGVGNVWGTLAGAGLIGVLQKGIEWLNPSNTLAAQTYMILFIILFIQIRPKGIVALKGRAAGD